MKYEVRNRSTGGVLFVADIECDEGTGEAVKLGLAVRWAVENGADLRRADLRGVYLRGVYLRDADLRGSDLIDGGQRSDGYRFGGQIRDGALWIHAGCRYFPIAEARKHWQETRSGTPLGDETMARLDMIEAVAKARGLLSDQKAAA